ncbi:putative xylose isormerase domain protein, TIM barrel [Desulfosarcina variabilis str. Montpellier]|uniref:sugar phosphate isomerase/epimerase family protein n=1 Tax=Desulfosarcina variabilis TaxID=2300 RepID=UPI003AFB4BE6
MINVGIMQGRLSEPPLNRIQAFPVNTWKDEFQNARQCDIAFIEWLFEDDRSYVNPITSEAGRESIQDCIERSGVRISSVCADYFMLNLFFRVLEEERAQNIRMLESIIRYTHEIGGETVLLPVLETSEIRSNREMRELAESLQRPLDLAESMGVRIGLETELESQKYLELVNRIDHPAIGVYYDTGNAAAKGYDCAKDIELLGSFIAGIHLKDRKIGGPTVPLGSGDVDFPAVFEAIIRVRFSGTLVLQAAPGKDYLGIAAGYNRFVREALSKAVISVKVVM